ncbi:MAG: hypothetical protein EA392_09630 [Cryomorphaceae bacterium]|nr:MAG: hypothetical protein EA392_09630 [Cryomorphaceae bacterium]
MSKATTYKETQRLTIWWVWLILLLINAFSAYALVQQMAFGNPVGNNPMSNTGLIIFAVLFLLLTVGFSQITLRTRLNEKGVHVQLFPFHLKYRTFGWEKITSTEVRQYNPIKEYGGWGLRMGPSGTAYNMKGNRGLQLVLNNGKRILIGTQKPEQINAFLQSRSGKSTGSAG